MSFRITHTWGFSYMKTGIVASSAISVYAGPDAVLLVVLSLHESCKGEIGKARFIECPPAWSISGYRLALSVA